MEDQKDNKEIVYGTDEQKEIDQINSFEKDDNAILELINESKERQLFALRSMRSAAIIAVNGVQDMRIGFLEKPEKPSLNEILTDLTFNTLLSFGLAVMGGPGIKSLLDTLMTPILRSRHVFNASATLGKLSDRGFSAYTRINYSIVRKNKGLLTDRFLDEIKEKDLAAAYSFSISKDIQNGYNHIDKTKKMMDKLSKAGKYKEPEVRSSLSGNLLEKVLSHVNYQMYEVGILHKSYEVQINSGLLNKKENKLQKIDLIRLLMENCAPVPRPDQFPIAYDNLARFFEACLWAKYLSEDLLYKDPENPDVVGWEAIGAGNFIVKGAGKELSTYLAKRLVNEKGISFFTAADARGGGKALESAITTVGQYLRNTLVEMEKKKNNKFYKALRNPENLSR
ncbi:MAG: hypothetical protein R8P61_14545 [Bacteroidia bacterium]|nr:hypothetical protein [Bacteroidia bacterium]